MAAKKNKAKIKAKPRPAHAAEKNPDFMVQVPEARMLRKDILENVREVIIFMQGFENFHKIQEEKIATFAKLRGQLRDLNRMIEDQLRKAFPRGKLKAAEKGQPAKKEEKPEAAPVEVLRQQSFVSAPPPSPEPSEEEPSELDQLEAQLQSIENQLRNVR
jgi:hypothetical protein